MRTRAIIYDFDGVICDSVNVKTEAFAELYREHGDDVVLKVVKYHLAHGGISRFEKIRHYHKELLGIELSQLEINDLANRFSSLAKDRVISCSYISGAYEFLQQYKNRYAQFICTGTPETEMIDILKARGLTSFFAGVYGAPMTKPDILKKIMDSYDFAVSDTVFLGDAMTDWDAANIMKVPFIGFSSPNTEFPEGTVLVKDFLDPVLTSYFQ